MVNNIIPVFENAQNHAVVYTKKTKSVASLIQ